MSDERTGRELTPQPGEDRRPSGASGSLPVTRQQQGASSVERFTAGETAHTVGLTEERAAGIVRQSGNARTMAFLATLAIVLFVPLYWFYDIGFPFVPNSARLPREEQAQLVTDVSRGYRLYLANCAQCHGAEGKGGGPAAYGPPLNDQGKLYNAVTPAGLPGTGHLNPNYLRNVLTVGGRYVCGNPQSQMPVWAEENGGPLNYREIEELITFITASKDITWDYIADTHGEGTQEQTEGGEGSEASEIPEGPVVLNGWRDPAYSPPPDATPVPECWSRPEGGDGNGGDGGGSPAPSAAPIENPGTAEAPRVIQLVETAALTIENRESEKLTAIPIKAGETITFEVENTAGYPHNFYVGAPADLQANAKDKLEGIPEWNSGLREFTWTVPADASGELQYACTVPGHYDPMHGTFQIQP